MTEFKERKRRFFEEINVEETLEFLKVSFLNKKLKVKYSLENTELSVTDFFDDSSVMIVTDADFAPVNDEIMAYGLIDKYVEFDFTVLEKTGAGYFHCSIRGGRRATTGRKDVRFKIKDNDVVATNFRISKYSIDVSSINIPTSIKVIIDQYASQNQRRSDVFNVNVFGVSDAILEHIRRTSKTLFIEDVTSDDSYAPANESFVDLKQILGHDFALCKKKYIEKGYKSVIIAPIIYITDNETSVPFAYIEMISKQRNFTMDDIITIKEESFNLVERIRNSNTMMIAVHQPVIDISRGGVRIRISDDNMKKSLIRAQGFVFDVLFKLQAPITIYGEVKFTGVDMDHNLLVGVSFAGNSSRKNEMKRFYEIMQPMEIEYKKRLIQQMKSGR